MAIVLILLITVFYGSNQSDANLITMNSFDCKPGPLLCKNLICNTVKTRSAVSKLNCGCFLPRTLYNITAELKLAQKRGSKYHPMIGSKENMCEVQRKTIRSQVMVRVFEHIKHYFTNFECPFHGNITATNMPISLTFAPGLLPPAVYKLTVAVEDSNDKEPIITVTLNFTIGKIKFRG